MLSRNGIVELIARICLSGVFIYYALRMLIFPSTVLERMFALNLPVVPVLFIIILSMIILGSISLILGYRTRTAAGVLLIFSLLFVITNYPPWKFSHFFIFLCWLGVIGGLLKMMIHGPGLISFDGRNMVPVRRKSINK